MSEYGSKNESTKTAVRKPNGRRPLPAGVRPRHRVGCPALGGARCRCNPAYEASVYSRHEQRKIRRTFRTPTEARRWRTSMLKLADDGALRVASQATLREAAQRFLVEADSGVVRNRSGDRYKPSALRRYDDGLRLRLLPELASYRLGEISRSQVQRLVDRWQREGLSPSTIRNTVNALRVIYRSADQLVEGVIVQNPTVGLRLPAQRGRRERVAAMKEATRLLEALTEMDRALWGMALYAGLRLGELLAVRWSDIDLVAGTISVTRGYDPRAGYVEPKSRAGRRRVPIVGRLRELLIRHRELTGRGEGDLVFGRTTDRPFAPSAINDRAYRHWAEAGLRPITMHECRHTCASYFIAAGVNPKTLSTFLGHASVTITFDRYGHLFPGAEAEAAALIDAYLDG